MSEQDGWGGGLRKLHWITDDGALCNPKLGIRQMAERDATGRYLDDYACKHCKAKLAYRMVR